MYVCICNALNEKQVRQAVNDGCKSCKDIWKYYDTEGQCRKCVTELHEILKENKDGIDGNDEARSCHGGSEE